MARIDPAKYAQWPISALPAEIVEVAKRHNEIYAALQSAKRREQTLLAEQAAAAQKIACYEAQLKTLGLLPIEV